MTETLEWFQCKACGRRHRWQADIAGTEIECHCGKPVLCPALEVFSEPDPADTAMDPGASRGLRGAKAGPIRRMEGEFDVEAPVAAPRTYRGSGLSPFAKALLWSIGAAIGFVLLMHAVIVQLWWYIALTVIWTPLSFWKFLKARKRWQGNRSLKRAFLEQVGGDDDDGEDKEP